MCFCSILHIPNLKPSTNYKLFSDWLAVELDFELSLLGPNFVCFLKKSTNLTLLFRKNQDDVTFETLKKSLMMPPALGHPNY